MIQKFAAVAGTRYYFALDAPMEKSVASLLLMPDPINDNFTNRIVLSGYTTHAAGSNVGATIQPRRKPACFQSRWRFGLVHLDGSSGGDVTINYSGEGFYPGVAVYTGSSVSVRAWSPTTHFSAH